MRNLMFAAVCAVSVAGCGSAGSAAPATQQVTPVYNKETGRLEELAGDRNGDGKVDTRAYMDGVNVRRVEIDRNRDGQADRWEFYTTSSTTGAPQIERAEESDGADGRITRREVYEAGRIARVEEDTNGDGRVDKWEYYVGSSLGRVELDLDGRGKPTQRLTYDPSGAVSLVESDPDGDGTFAALKSPSR
jgi:hypothetical protein